MALTTWPNGAGSFVILVAVEAGCTVSGWMLSKVYNKSVVTAVFCVYPSAHAVSRRS
jgi:uncharacterized membrane protein AbrB (regulator of aidB expression)